MNIRIMLVDDEQHCLDLLDMHAKKIFGVQIVARELDPVKAMNMILNKEVVVDAVYLDISMRGLGGLDFAGLVGHLVRVVFTTAYRKFAPESYLHNAIEYLVKPVTFERFLVSIDKLRKVLSSENIEHLSIPGNGKGAFFIIEIKNILYVEGSSNYVKVCTENKEYLTNYSMMKMESLLPPNQFFRVHKSYIINLKKIVEADTENAYLASGKEVPIGESYRKQFMNLMKPK